MPREVELDGQSLSKILMDPEKETDLSDRTLIVHSQRVENPEKWRNSSVMKQNWRLINGKYLYDLESDRAQEKDIASQHPEMVKELRESYETWWKSVSTRFEEYVRIPLGAEAAPNVLLTCHDWHVTEGEVPWNQGKIKADMASNGFWAVDVKEAGKYQMTLRARPEGVKYKFNTGEARVKVGDREQKVTVAEGQDSITLSIDLPSGPTSLQTWISEGDQKIRGAYFVQIDKSSE
jgi:hypothetical protein